MPRSNLLHRAFVDPPISRSLARSGAARVADPDRPLYKMTCSARSTSPGSRPIHSTVETRDRSLEDHETMIPFPTMSSPSVRSLFARVTIGAALLPACAAVYPEL